MSRLYGSETPRIYTPPRRELSPETSAGFSVLRFAKEILGLTLRPWQEWILTHALEIGTDGSFRFDTVVLLVGRQNGKTLLGQVLALWSLYVRQDSLVLGTAQDLDTASEAWRGTVEIAEGTAELKAEIRKISNQMSRETLELSGGRRYKVRASSRGGGRGMTGDLILLDELREHTSWDAWSALTKTTMARSESLTFAMSNAGDSSSVVLRYLRMLAHYRIGDPDGITIDPITGESKIPEGLRNIDEPEDGEKELAIFEWSAPPGVSVTDRSGWAAANPSLGHGNPESKIASAVKQDPEWTFRTEILCQWPVGTLQGPFRAGDWEAGQSRAQPPAGTEYVLGIDVSVERDWADIVAAYYMPDGRIQVSLEASRSGVDWITEWLEEAGDRENPLPLAAQGRGAPVSDMLDDISAVPGVEVVEWKGLDLSGATAYMYDLVRQGELLHLPAPGLDRAAGAAQTRTLGDGGRVWDRKGSPINISPLVAATTAVWLLARADRGPSGVSAYDTGASLVMVG